MKVFASSKPLSVYKKIIDLNLNNKRVLIKPNLVTNINSKKGVTTDLILIKKLVNYLQSKGAVVTVGELPIDHKIDVLKELGFYKLPCKVINFRDEKWIKVKSKTGLVLKELILPESALKADLIISFAKLKTHALTTVTLSIKNLFGLLNSGERRKAHVKGLNESIVDILSCFDKEKIIGLVDGLIALDGRLGPINGSPRKVGLIIGSKDLLSCDSFCTDLIGGNPKRVKHLILCSKYKLGEINYDLEGIKLFDYKQKFNLPPSFFYLSNKLLNYYRKKKPYLITKNCVKCKSCVNNCPTGAITLNDEIRFDYKKCIGCMVCLESCNYKAISYKLSLPARVIHPIYKRLKNFFSNLRTR